MSNTYLYSALAVMALVTAALRFLPFLLFGGGRKTPKTVEKLSRTLPSAVMAMLVVYCLKGVCFDSVGSFLPEVLASLTVAVLHIWRRNTLLSIVGGTLCYMLLVQTVF
jgi:branched-subunit amino acid transport protein AzlD